MTATLDLAFIAEPDFGRHGVFVVSLVLDDVDTADQGATTEQGRLGALGHFDAFNVEELDVGAARPRDRDTVLEHGDTRFRGRLTTVRGDTADRVAGIVRALLLNDQARREGCEILEIGDIEIFKQSLIERRHIDRNIRDGLFAELGGDGDHLYAGLIGILLRVCCAANSCETDQGGCRKKT